MSRVLVILSILVGLFLSTLSSHADVPLTKPPVSFYDCAWHDEQVGDRYNHVIVCRMYDPAANRNFIFTNTGYSTFIIESEK